MVDLEKKVFNATKETIYELIDSKVRELNEECGEENENETIELVNEIRVLEYALELIDGVVYEDLHYRLKDK